MHFIERRRLLKDCDADWWFAICTSADFDFSKDDAAMLDSIYDLKAKLTNAFPEYLSEWAPGMPDEEIRGDCLVVSDVPVMNLVIKMFRNRKPTYESLQAALTICRQKCNILGIKHLAMPAIACVDDSLYWSKVMPMIKETFADSDIEIMLCLPPRKKGRPAYEQSEEEPFD